MRRYTITVNGKTHSLDVRELSADRFEVNFEDRRLDVQLLDETDLPEAAITPVMAAALGSHPMVGTPAVELPVPTQSGAAVAPAPMARPAVPNTASVSTSRTLTAPMPGTLLSVEVKQGARVKRGDVLVTLEAMKMVNPIRAPRDAVVSEVVVAAGQTVAYGDTLMRFEE